MRTKIKELFKESPLNFKEIKEFIDINYPLILEKGYTPIYKEDNLASKVMDILRYSTRYEKTN